MLSSVTGSETAKTRSYESYKVIVPACSAFLLSPSVILLHPAVTKQSYWYISFVFCSFDLRLSLPVPIRLYANICDISSVKRRPYSQNTAFNQKQACAFLCRRFLVDV